jgi:hypothetical protein
MTQVSASGLNCSRERALNEEVAAACIVALIYSLQARWSKGINVLASPSWVERNLVVPTTNRNSLTGNIAKKLTQAKNFSNSPFGTAFWAQRGC